MDDYDWDSESSLTIPFEVSGDDVVFTFGDAERLASYAAVVKCLALHGIGDVEILFLVRSSGVSEITGVKVCSCGLLRGVKYANIHRIRWQTKTKDVKVLDISDDDALEDFRKEFSGDVDDADVELPW
jgi:hypothetical protein